MKEFPKDRCIFETKELRHLCKEESCNQKKDRCMTKAYVNLVEDYVGLCREKEIENLKKLQPH